MLSEFLMELKLNAEQEKITQIVTSSSGTHMKPSAYDEYVNAREKAKKEMERMESRTGDCLAMNFGDLTDVDMVTIVRSIIPDNNQDDVQLVDQLDIIPLSALGR